MKTSWRIWQYMDKHFVMIGTFASMLLFSVIFTLSVGAQTRVTWSDPTNISQSGSASDPVMVVDSDGVFHALWLDEFAGLYYSSGDGSEWSVPIAMTLPSGDIVPDLVADKNGLIHALWTDEDNRLFYSRARASVLPNSSAWTARALVNDDVLDFDVTVDDLGDLHLSFISPVETSSTQPGVYYRRMRGGTSTWLRPTLLYTSPYFRSLELADSNIDVSTSVVGEEKRIFVAWDNRPRERVYLATSDDDGSTWSEPIEVDQPQAGIVGSGPSNLLVEANGDQVMLLWRMGEKDSFCNQYYQWSQDRGETWSLRQPVYGSTPICLDNFQFIPGEDYSILMGDADQVYFLAWDGSRWSDPQPQETLTSFVDAETQNLVEMGCLQLLRSGPSYINAIGCDLGAGQDVWTLRRQLLDVAGWFPVETGWGALEEVEVDDVRLLSPVIIFDRQDQAHLLWSKSESIQPDSLGKSILYTVQQDGLWSPSAEILMSTSGKAEQIDAVIDSNDRIFVVWSGGSDGEIFFSQADISQAFVPDSWSEPIILPAPLPVGSSPDILVDDNDVIYVVYAVPLNEQRGIYRTVSDDGGDTWNEPTLVFDAQGEGWAMVNDPRLAITENGDLHLLWTRYSLPNGEGPLGLYYASSVDGGDTWSAPELVVQGPVVWSEIVGTGDTTIQRVWQQGDNSSATLWHEQSEDGGQTWERIMPVSVFGEIVGNPSIFADISGRLHLLIIVRNGVTSYLLQHWVYNGQNWTSESSLGMEYLPQTDIASLASDVSDNGKLSVVLLNSNFTEEATGNYRLVNINNSIVIPSATINPLLDATPLPTITPTEVVTKEEINPTPTPTVTPTKQIAFTNEPGNASFSRWVYILGPVAIGLIIVVVIVLIYRWTKR